MLPWSSFQMMEWPLAEDCWWPSRREEKASEGLISTLKRLAWRGPVSVPFTAHWPAIITWDHSIQEVSEVQAYYVLRTWKAGNI